MATVSRSASVGSPLLLGTLGVERGVVVTASRRKELVKKRAAKKAVKQSGEGEEDSLVQQFDNKTEEHPQLREHDEREKWEGEEQQYAIVKAYG